MSGYREPYQRPSDECYVQRVFLLFKEPGGEFKPPPGGGWELVSSSAFDEGDKIVPRTNITLTWRRRPE